MHHEPVHVGAFSLSGSALAAADVLQQQEQRGGCNTGDALSGGDGGRPRGAQLLAVLCRQLHRVVVQVRRQRQRLPPRQLGRLRRLRSRTPLFFIISTPEP